MDAALLDDDEITTLSQPFAEWEQVYTGPDITIYRNNQAVPLAFVVGAVHIEPDLQAQIALLTDPAFVPAQQAVLAHTVDLPFDPNATGTARVVRRSLNTLELDVQVGAMPGYGALLLVRQNYFPGWQARVDGTSVPVLQADVSLQGVPVMAGNHRVTLTFTPSYFWELGAVALGGFACSLMLLFGWPRRNKRGA